MSRVNYRMETKTAHPIHCIEMPKKPNRNQMPSGICTAKRRLWVDGDGAPGKGQRANRNALAPSPGLKAVKE